LRRSNSTCAIKGASEHRATDRAHRIGQTKPVFVYKLIAADTVEERIIELQDKRGRLAAATLDAGAAVGSLVKISIIYSASEVPACAITITFCPGPANGERLGGDPLDVGRAVKPRIVV
jgi:hypothetical protein